MKKLVGIIMVAMLVMVGYTNTVEAMGVSPQKAIQVFEELEKIPEPEEYMLMALVEDAFQNKNVILFKIYSEELNAYRERKRVRRAMERQRIIQLLDKVKANNYYRQ